MNKININESSNKYKSKIIEILNYLFKVNIKEKKNNGKELSNIMEKYFENPKKIDIDNKFLALYIKAYIEYIKIKNNILIPFLIPTCDLIKSYINSDLDEEIEQNDNNNNIKNNNINIINDDNLYNYNQIFLLLKRNSFISKQVIIEIYSYFSKIYHDINYNNSNNKKYIINLKKFKKMIKLWKIFYTFEDKQNYSVSTFCSLGSGLLLSFKEPFSLDNQYIQLKIKFYEDINLYNLNLIDDQNIEFLNINDDLKFNYDSLKKRLDKIIVISFKIYKKYVNATILYKSENNLNIEKEEIKKYKEIQNIKDITFLKNYKGQIKVINVKLKKEKQHEIYSNYLFEPIPYIEDGFLREVKITQISGKTIKEVDGKDNNTLYKIKILDKDLFKINYVNYNNKDFNVIDYYGGVIQLLPYADLIKKLYLNEKLNSNIIKIEVKKYYISFIEDIINGLVHCLIYSKKNTKNIKKYYLFVFSIILELLSTLFKDDDNIEEKEIAQFNVDQFILENIEKLDIEKQPLIHIYVKFINFGTTKYNILIKEIEDLVKQIIKDEINANEFNYNVPFQQLYTKLIKELFVYNRLWSDKNAFFNNNNNNYKVKYKQHNHYTKNYQRPILYPILELKKFFPQFKKFKTDDLFKYNNDKILDYDFSFFDENNIIIKCINTTFNKDKELISLKCCFVKKMYHIKGNLVIKEIDNNNKKKFELIFISNNSNNDETCNNPIENGKEEINRFKLCYGSMFPYDHSKYRIQKKINSNKIIFVLKREYFHRVSAIEIFTYNNKSYLFNFYEPFNIKINNNSFVESNKIISKISEYFPHKIIINKEKQYFLLGYYNKRYKLYMFPLFHEEINNWENKHKYYSNYDKLILINIFSNRSFNDIYQYPVFPMFYNIYYKRDMSNHIGLQSITKNNEQRKNNLLYTYKVNKNNIKDNDEEVILFNTLYSNPVYLCYYLLRIFPYSLLSIEFQGGGFDNPNRLFSSIETTLNNNMTQNSDLREMIPEFFYLPELFQNKNEINIGGKNKNDIDNVIIKGKYNDFDKYEFIAKMKNVLEEEKDLGLWIDLIFGVNQRETKDKIQYYKSETIVNYNNDEKIYNNSFILESSDFGIIPFQLLNNKFPNFYLYSNDYIPYIKKYNSETFKEEHLTSNIGKITFICNAEFIMSKEYFNKLNQKRIIKYNYLLNIYEENKFTYIFKGDIFGNISIYMNRNDNDNSNDSIKSRSLTFLKLSFTNNNMINNNTIIKNEKYKHKIKIISDHSKAIKYIDYNPRLNLFLSYSLDGFINIYTFPNWKLVSVIKISDYIENELHPLNEVVLVSNPFPMIFCYNEEFMFVFTINGELINKKEKKKYIDIYPCIDKSLGLISDSIRTEKKITINIINYSEIELPSLEIKKNKK